MSRKSTIYNGMVTEKSTALSKPLEILPAPTGLMDRCGFDPVKLDPVIEVLIDNADTGARLLQEYTPLLAGIMQRMQHEVAMLLQRMKPSEGETATGEVKPAVDAAVELQMMLKLAREVSTILERLNRMTMQAVKSKDDAVRLRTYLVTGDEEGTKLDNLGETALRKMIMEAAAGWQKPADA